MESLSCRLFRGIHSGVVSLLLILICTCALCTAEYQHATFANRQPELGSYLNGALAGLGDDIDLLRELSLNVTASVVAIRPHSCASIVLVGNLTLQSSTSSASVLNPARVLHFTAVTASAESMPPQPSSPQPTNSPHVEMHTIDFGNVVVANMSATTLGDFSSESLIAAFFTNASSIAVAVDVSASPSGCTATEIVIGSISVIVALPAPKFVVHNLPSPVDVDGADAKCKEAGMILASIRSVAENDEATRSPQMVTSSRYFFGARSFPNTECAFCYFGDPRFQLPCSAHNDLAAPVDDPALLPPADRECYADGDGVGSEWLLVAFFNDTDWVWDDVPPSTMASGCICEKAGGGRALNVSSPIALEIDVPRNVSHFPHPWPSTPTDSMAPSATPSIDDAVLSSTRLPHSATPTLQATSSNSPRRDTTATRTRLWTAKMSEPSLTLTARPLTSHAPPSSSAAATTAAAPTSGIPATGPLGTTASPTSPPSTVPPAATTPSPPPPLPPRATTAPPAQTPPPIQWPQCPVIPSGATGEALVVDAPLRAASLAGGPVTVFVCTDALPPLRPELIRTASAATLLEAITVQRPYLIDVGALSLNATSYENITSSASASGSADGQRGKQSADAFTLVEAVPFWSGGVDPSKNRCEASTVEQKEGGSAGVTSTTVPVDPRFARWKLVLRLPLAAASPDELLTAVAPPPVALTIRGAAFACENPSNDFVVLISVARATPPNAALATSVVSFGVAASLLGAALGSPTLGAQAMRAMPLISLRTCQFDNAGPLRFGVAYVPWAVGPPVGQYFRGCLAVNASILFGAAALHFLIGVAHYFKTRPNASGWRKRLKASLAFVRFPGLLVIPVLLMLPGIVTCATAVGFHGEQTFDLVLTLAAVVTTLCVIATVYFSVFRRFDATLCSATPQYVAAHTMQIFFTGASKWEDGRRRNFRLHFGRWFSDYTASSPRFIMVELVTIILAAFLEGVRPNSRRMCSFVALGFLGMAASALIAVVAFNPFIATFTKAQAVVATSLTGVAALLLTVALTTEDVDRSAQLATGSEYVVLLVAIIGAVKVAIDGVFWLPKRRMPVVRPPAAASAATEAEAPLLHESSLSTSSGAFGVFVAGTDENDDPHAAASVRGSVGTTATASTAEPGTPSRSHSDHFIGGVATDNAAMVVEMTTVGTSGEAGGSHQTPPAPLGAGSGVGSLRSSLNTNATPPPGTPSGTARASPAATEALGFDADDPEAAALMRLVEGSGASAGAAAAVALQNASFSSVTSALSTSALKPISGSSNRLKPRRVTFVTTTGTGARDSSGSNAIGNCIGSAAAVDDVALLIL